MVEREHVVRALQGLAYKVEVGNVEIRGFAGRRTGVEIKVPTRNHGYDIGFLPVNGAYEVIADW
jgi:hypothetical protein